MNEESKLNQLIKNAVYVVIIVLIITVVALLILKYEVEGEKNMPFKLSSIVIVSNAEGYQEKENKDYLWDVDVIQNNDIYLNIEKNKNYKEEEIIKSVVIDNIKIDEAPRVGKIDVYRLSSESQQIYNYQEEYLINEKVEYLADTFSDVKNLKISNQGGTIILRVINKTGKKYTSNEKEFEHNGRLLNKVGLEYDDIKTKISFDLSIVLESGIVFKANIKMNLPVGDIINEGTSNLEKKDMKDIVFKRK